MGLDIPRPYVLVESVGGQNLWVRVGTPIGHTVRHLGLDEARFDRFAYGSALIGWSVPNASVPVVKVSAGVVG